MKIEDDDGPALGEVRLGPECPHGYRECTRRLDSGEVENRTVRRMSGEAHSTPPGDYPIDDLPNGRGFMVRRRRRGPASANSRAYRSGWDNVYGRHQGKSS